MENDFVREDSNPQTHLRHGIPLGQHRIWLAGTFVAALLLGIGIAVLWTNLLLLESRRDAAARLAGDVPSELTDDENANVELFRLRSRSVVFIATAGIRQDAFSLDVTEIPRGAGTGVVWGDRGHIVTNFHVIEGAAHARVTHGDKAWDARLVGVLPDKDIAVLKIDAAPDLLRALPLGTSRNLQVGQKVLAIGNPFGLDQTLTTGVISGLGREIKARTGRMIQDVIQTDAAINPGNSGGPLLDSAGRMIGLNTAIYSPSGVYAGVGFAIPVDTVNRVVSQIVEHGSLVRPGFGVRIFTSTILRRYGLQGALVRDVVPGSAAEAANIRGTVFADDGTVALGDIIVAIDGNSITDADSFYRILDRHKVGDTMEIEVLRHARTANARKEKRSVTLQPSN